MSSRLILLAALLALPFARAPLAQEPALEPRAGYEPWKPDGERFLFHAVLEGLYADGVSNEVVDALLELDADLGWPRFFIYGCPICMPAFNAFRAYRARPEFFGDKQGRDTFGAGLPEHVRANLLTDDLPVRVLALQARVSVWVERRVNALRLDERERGMLEERLGARRKQGLNLLRDYRRDERTAAVYAHMESCPFCDGANAAMGQ